MNGFDAQVRTISTLQQSNICTQESNSERKCNMSWYNSIEKVFAGSRCIETIAKTVALKSFKVHGLK